MNMFAKETVGRNIRCLLEKDGEQVVDYVKWIHVYKDGIVKRKIHTARSQNGKNPNYSTEISDGWKIVEMGV